MLSFISRIGGPWQLLDAGKRLWATLAAATRRTRPQVEAKATLVRMLASRFADDTALIAELAALVEAEVGGD